MGDSWSDELDALWAMVPADGTTYVMFNEMPRVEDSARFVARAPS